MATSTLETLKFDLSQIREFWADQANTHGASHAASWSDRPVIEMEIERIAGYLNAGDRVLDIGCANGFSTIEFAQRKSIQIYGLDYIPEMIQQANARLTSLDESFAKRVRFDVGDITKLAVPDASFDRTIVIRVIINLENWQQQITGLKEAARTVKPGGLLLLSEATVQGLERLNQFRGEWGLPPIPEPAFNRYLDEIAVQRAVAAQLDLVEIVNFASTYFVGTRVFKPLLARLLDCEQQIPNPDMHFNRWFASMPPAGDYGTQKLFVFRKR